ncbi:hypothetical protein VTN00DRAFT_6001 [Thermoascus crustaceus]|uniref:uncharacterized protein n=1 Tax=Thermoascus crustaceus TaxID=5088 RepID=UPI0037442BD3
MSVRNQSHLSSPGFDDCVGTLFEWDPVSGPASNPFKFRYYEEIYIGRDPKKCQYVVEDPVVSNKHVRIYTIIFDHENPEEVAPLVYAQDLSRNGTSWNGSFIGKGTGGVLLSDGDVLRLSPRFYIQFRCGTRPQEDAFDRVQRSEMKSFEKQYTITNRKLGSGAYGQVHMAINKETGQQVACKVVDIRGLRRKLQQLEAQKSTSFRNSRKPAAEVNDHAQVEEVNKWTRRNYQTKYIEKKIKVYDREAEILENLRHPNIISLEQVIKTQNTIYIFQDLITAGDLFSFLEYKGGRLNDIETAVIVRQILMALEYLHDKNIVHRDLKPDNILMTSLADGCRVVLTDFGCARVVEPNLQRMSTLMGTLEYTAPEVIRSASLNREGYTKAVDLWSLGCITVVLLTGGPPFNDPKTSKYSEKHARECDLEQLEADEYWISAGERPKDFVYRLLVLDEAKRMDVKQALQHDWFTNPVHKSEFEELYKRAIKDWKPRPFRGPIFLEYDPVAKKWKRRNKDKEVRQPKQPVPIDPPYKPYPHRLSQILYPKPPRSASGTVPPSINFSSRSVAVCTPSGKDRAASPTLSDPDLPKLSKAAKKKEVKEISLRKGPKSNATKILDDPKGLGIITNRLKSCIRLPFSPGAWRERREDSILSEAKESNEETILQLPLSMTPTRLSTNAPTTAETKDAGTSTRVYILQRFSKTANMQSKKRPLDSIGEPEEDEVYEEVENAFSGERRKVIYGANTAARAKRLESDALFEWQRRHDL